MRDVLSILFLFFLSASLIFAQPDSRDEKEAVKKVIADSYIDGAFNKGDAVALKKGVHYDCDILILEDGKFRKTPAYSYLERIEKNPVGIYPGTTCKFVEVHVTGYAAMAIVDIYRNNGRHDYTDYLSLYKFDDGWKIVSRIAYRYPKTNN